MGVDDARRDHEFSAVDHLGVLGDDNAVGDRFDPSVGQNDVRSSESPVAVVDQTIAKYGSRLLE